MPATIFISVVNTEKLWSDIYKMHQNETKIQRIFLQWKASFSLLDQPN